MHCAVSWCTEHGDGPWPDGEWFHCPTEATKVVVIKITPDTIIKLNLCEAHQELWDTEKVTT